MKKTAGSQLLAQGRQRLNREDHPRRGSVEKERNFQQRDVFEPVVALLGRRRDGGRMVRAVACERVLDDGGGRRDIVETEHGGSERLCVAFAVCLMFCGCFFEK